MQIYDHDTPETITFKSSALELDNWINHLNYIDNEINNLVNLARLQLSNINETQPVLTKLKLRKKENGINITAFNKYKNNLHVANECDDVACDIFYVEKHEQYRQVYLYYLEKYRRVKEEYFSILTNAKTE